MTQQLGNGGRIVGSKNKRHRVSCSAPANGGASRKTTKGSDYSPPFAQFPKKCYFFFFEVFFFAAGFFAAFLAGFFVGMNYSPIEQDLRE